MKRLRMMEVGQEKFIEFGKFIKMGEELEKTRYEGQITRNRSADLYVLKDRGKKVLFHKNVAIVKDYSKDGVIIKATDVFSYTGKLYALVGTGTLGNKLTLICRV